MKVLAITFVHNELEFISKAVRYYQNQGCLVYVIDNMSDDGTWEWLQENNISSSRCDTDGTFQLDWLQREMVKVLHNLKPDWFIWFSPDLYHVFEESIYATIEKVDKDGYNQITSPCYCFRNTGEVNNQDLYSEITILDMIDIFYYATRNDATHLISKYHKEIQIGGDSIFIPNAKKVRMGMIFEYGACKSIAIQERKLARRIAAWRLKGLPSNYGTHYLNGKKNNWIFLKEDSIDTTTDAKINEMRTILKASL